MLDSDRQLEIETPELTAACVASEIVLPMIFAVMLNLLMQPALRALERLRVPKTLGAILLILIVFAPIVGLGAAVSGPAEAWTAKLPEGIPRILERLRFLDAPINTLRTFLAAANNFGAAGPQQSSAGLWTPERFSQASLPGRGASPAVCSPLSCLSTPCLFRATAF